MSEIEANVMAIEISEIERGLTVSLHDTVPDSEQLHKHFVNNDKSDDADPKWNRCASLKDIGEIEYVNQEIESVSADYSNNGLGKNGGRIDNIVYYILIQNQSHVTLSLSREDAGYSVVVEERTKPRIEHQEDYSIVVEEQTKPLIEHYLSDNDIGLELESDVE